MYFKDKNEYRKFLDKNQIEDFDNSVEKYNKNFFQWSEEGEILLEYNKCQKSAKSIEDYSSCIGWILLNDGKTMALLKNSFGDTYRDLPLEDYYIALYNNLLIPQIARQLGNKSANYYFTKIPNKNIKYILTIDFKNKDEELISGNDILTENNNSTDILDIDKLLENLEDYLIEKGFSSQDMEKVRIDFIKQCFFNKFIQQLDEHNGNWGILEDYKNHSVKIAPVYDLDCSCGIAKRRKKQRLCKNGSFSLKSFIKEFSNEQWFNQYLQEIIQKFDIHKALEEAKENTNAEIPKIYREKYIDFFNHRIQEVKEAYYEFNSDKEKNNELEIN